MVSPGRRLIPDPGARGAPGRPSEKADPCSVPVSSAATGTAPIGTGKQSDPVPCAEPMPGSRMLATPAIDAGATGDRGKRPSSREALQDAAGPENGAQNGAEEQP